MTTFAKDVRAAIDHRDDPKEHSTRDVVVIIALLMVVVIALVIGTSKFTDAKDVVAIVGSVAGVVGTLAGAFFGVRAGAVGRDKAEAERDKAEAARKSAESQLNAVADILDPGQKAKFAALINPSA